MSKCTFHHCKYYNATCQCLQSTIQKKHLEMGKTTLDCILMCMCMLSCRVVYYSNTHFSQTLQEKYLSTTKCCFRTKSGVGIFTFSQRALCEKLSVNCNISSKEGAVITTLMTFLMQEKHAQIYGPDSLAAKTISGYGQHT